MKYGGSGWGSFVRGGTRVTKPLQVCKGQVLLEQSDQFHARNVVRVIKTFDDRIYCRFVDPKDVRKPRSSWDMEFCIWDFEMKGIFKLYIVEAVQ